MCLSTEENAKIKQENQEFIKRNMITLICVPIKGQKEVRTNAAYPSFLCAAACMLKQGVICYLFHA